MITVHPLRSYNVPDIGDHLIHFTGRTGQRVNVDDNVATLSPEDRLWAILLHHAIRGFATFGALSPVSCFTESTKAAVARLVGDRRYAPWGIGFTKQFVFDNNGAPVMYVRGDEWAHVERIGDPLRSRTVRFWPGAGGELLPTYMATPSEWLHEREWRVLGDLRFGWDDVAFLIVGDEWWQYQRSTVLAGIGAESLGALLELIPVVVLSDAGEVVEDSSGVWA